MTREDQIYQLAVQVWNKYASNTNGGHAGIPGPPGSHHKGFWSLKDAQLQGAIRILTDLLQKTQ